MPELLAHLTRVTIHLTGGSEAVSIEANREPAGVLAEQLRPTRPAGLGWPTLRWASFEEAPDVLQAMRH